MTELYSTSIIRNIYKRPSTNSEVSSQIIYGEKIRVLGTKNIWMIIRTLSDNYSGYIKKEKRTFVNAINIPAKNIDLITPDLIANIPPNKVKITVVTQPKVFE